MLSTVTSTMLLDGLKDAGNQTVWQDYVGRYRPLLVDYARRLQLPPADAEDLAQQVLMAFATAYRDGKYDPRKGRLRAWLFGIARTTIRNWRARQRPRELQVADTGEGTGFVAQVQDEDRMERLWEERWQQAVLQQCLTEVRREVEDKTFRAFEMFARQGMPAKQVAEELGISQNAVFGARRRVLRRIREILPLMEEAW